MAIETLSPNTDELRRAAGDVFNAIESSVCSAHELVGEAIGAGDASPAMLVSLFALLQQAGILAARAGAACGSPGAMSEEQWAASSRGLSEALATLKRSAGAAA
jgi:hypothetical protein